MGEFVPAEHFTNIGNYHFVYKDLRDKDNNYKSVKLFKEYFEDLYQKDRVKNMVNNDYRYLIKIDECSDTTNDKSTKTIRHEINLKNDDLVVKIFYNKERLKEIYKKFIQPQKLEILHLRTFKTPIK